VRCVLAEGERALDCGESTKAAACADEVRALTDTRPAPLLEGRAFVLAGRLAHAAREPDAASSLHHRALAIAESAEAPELVWMACAGLGELHGGCGRTRRALHWLRRCVDVLEGIVGRIVDAPDQEAYLGHPRRARAIGLLEAALRG
jgi:hypothetical protein